MKTIMRSKENEAQTAESGFDSNWTFLHSKMVFEPQSFIKDVSLVGSHRCKIAPKSLKLVANGTDLIVTSYAIQGVKTRAYKTSPFRKISKSEYTMSSKDHA